MIAYFLLGAALLFSLLLIARWVAAADPRALAKGMRYGGGTAAAGVVLYLVVSGRWPYVVAALSVAFPFMVRWKARRDRAGATRGPNPGARSGIQTRMLHVTLDHETGEMSGKVRAGAHAGRLLDSLSLAELVALLEECRRDDPPSAPLAETYIDRRFGTGWRAHAEEKADDGARTESGPSHARSAAMTRREALEMLGLEEGASRDQIKDAYRRLIVKLHPDAGGSAYLAAKLNQAKDVLLED